MKSAQSNFLVSVPVGVFSVAFNRRSTQLAPIAQKA